MKISHLKEGYSGYELDHGLLGVGLNNGTSECEVPLRREEELGLRERPHLA
jgi:hypothetical protein